MHQEEGTEALPLARVEKRGSGMHCLPSGRLRCDASLEAMTRAWSSPGEWWRLVQNALGWKDGKVCPRCGQKLRAGEHRVAVRSEEGERVFQVVLGAHFSGEEEGECSEPIWVREWTEELNRTQKLERELQSMEVLFQTSSDGLLWINAQGGVERCNQAFCRLLGLVIEPEVLAGVGSSSLRGWIEGWIKNPGEFWRETRRVEEAKTPWESEEYRVLDGRSFSRIYEPLRVRGRWVGHLWRYRDTSSLWRAREKAEHCQQEMDLFSRMVSRLEEGEGIEEPVKAWLSRLICQTRSVGALVWGGDGASTLLRLGAGEEMEPRCAEELVALVSSMGRPVLATRKGLMHHLKKRGLLLPAETCPETFVGTLLRVEGEPVGVLALWGRSEGYTSDFLASLFQTIQFGTGLLTLCVSAQYRHKLEGLLSGEEVLPRRTRTHFLAGMSHEIRTPLNVILGMVEMLRDTQPTWEQREHLKKIQHNAFSLQELFNDACDLSRIESGKMSLDCRKFFPLAVMDTVVEAFAGQVFEKGLDLLCDFSPDVPWVVGDPVRFRQLLTGLLTNAVKFTEDGQITLRIRAETGHDQTCLMCEVEDTGIGMSRQRVDQFLRPMEDHDPFNLKVATGGLGLHLVRALTQLMGGSMDMESEEGKGTCVRLRVQMASVVGEGRSSFRSLFYEKQVCLVGGSEVSREMVEKTLKQFGLEVWNHRRVEDLKEHREGQVRRDFVVWSFYPLNAPSLFLVEKALVDLFPDKKSKIVWWLPHGASEKTRALLEDTEHRAEEKPMHIGRLLSALGWSFDLPRTSFPAVYESSSKWSRAAPPRILLVEDNPDSRLIIGHLLEQDGCRVDSAADGRAGVKMASEFHYDLILMDLHMPSLDGLEATGLIRADERRRGLSPVPMVALTAHAMEEFRERCLDVGMDDYVTKPVGKHRLWELGRKWVDRRPRILVVDEALGRRMLLKHFLEHSPEFRVLLSATLEEGQEMVARCSVSLVFLRASADRSQRSEMRAFVRALRGRENIPVIGFTPEEDVEDSRWVLESGFSAIFSGVFHREAVLDLVYRLLRGETSRTEEQEQAAFLT